jgi:hypothetical protein
VVLLAPGTLTLLQYSVADKCDQLPHPPHIACAWIACGQKNGERRDSNPSGIYLRGSRSFRACPGWWRAVVVLVETHVGTRKSGASGIESAARLSARAPVE